MITTLLAAIFAGIALTSQPSGPVPDIFERRIERRGEVTVTQDFIGLTTNRTPDGEVWYAGLDLKTGEFVTGP